jgi:translation initiation factor 3 subunit C
LTTLDPNSSEYLDCLREEIRIYELLIRSHVCVSDRIGRVDANSEQVRELVRIQCNLILRRLDHIYFRSDESIEALEKPFIVKDWYQKIKIEVPKIEEYFYLTIDSFDQLVPTRSSKVINHLVCSLYRDGNDRERTQAILLHIYNYAFNGRYLIARDLMLLSHLQDNIDRSDIALRILYNRTIAQIGFAAFKNGKMFETVKILNELFESGQQYTLLGQDLNEIDRFEGFKGIPAHLYINLDRLEGIYLISILVSTIQKGLIASKKLMSIASIERPTVVPIQNGNKVCGITYLCKLFKSEMLRPFQGPPETFQSRIMESYKHLMAGDWKSAYEVVSGCNTLFTSGLLEEFKKQALHCYLLTNCNKLQTVSLEYLVNKFELPISNIYKKLCEWIFCNEMPLGTWIDELIDSDNEIDRMKYIHLGIHCVETNSFIT